MKCKPTRNRTILVIGVTFLSILMIIAIDGILDEKPVVFDENTSHWAAYNIPGNESLASNMDVDIAVIGGGYTGLSAAWHIATRNPEKKIILLEAKTLGNGASGRHGGMLLPALQPEIPEDTTELVHLKAMYDQSVNNIRKIQKIQRISGIECDLVLDGFLYTVFQKSDTESTKEFVHEFKRYGFPIEYWEKDKLVEEIGTSRYEGAVYVKHGGSLHAMKLIHALKVLCEQENVIIYENSPVTEIKEGNETTLAVGENGFIVKAKHIVLATNAFTTKLGYFKGKVLPLHIVTGATEPISPEKLQRIAWKSRMPFVDSRIELYHLVLTPDNRIIIGGGYSNYFYNNDLHFKDDIHKIAALLTDELVRLFPELEGIVMERVWNGIIGVTMDMNEIFGTTGKRNNIIYALGYNGHGVNTSILKGEVIADLYQGVNKEYLWKMENNPIPVPPEPFRFIGVKSYLMYAKWKDKRK